MAFCLDGVPTLEVGNPVIITGFDPVVCEGGVLMTSSDYAAFTASPTLQDIFSIPVAADLGQMWLVGFSLPLIIYLTAWALGVVVNFINTKQEFV